MTRVLRVEVASRASYLAADAPHGLTDALRDRLSVANPRYVAAKRMDRHPGKEPARLCGVTEFGNAVPMPRGGPPELREVASAGEVQVVVATQLADEGLDIPRLSRVYQTYPARAAGRTEQRLGRVMRPHPDVTDVATVDVVDPHVGVLAHQVRKRRTVYELVLGRKRTAEVA